MVEVTQEDIAAALSHIGFDSVEDLHYWAKDNNELNRFDALTQVLAAHRQAGVQQGLDMAAGVVERRKRVAAKAFDHAVEVRHHEHQTRFACQHREAEECAAELSKLGGSDGTD